jgi:hypothetical protein
MQRLERLVIFDGALDVDVGARERRGFPHLLG